MISKKRFLQAFIDTIPLSLSVTPWAILFGTLAIQSGLTGWQAQLMSLLVFAGAAQMSGVAIMGAGGSLASLLNSTAMISARHLLYSAAYKDHIRPLPCYQRVIFAFLLTDETFAVIHADQEKTGKFDYAYSITSGIIFYCAWNMATFIGIMAVQSVRGVDSLGFDFAIAATFIAMTIPKFKGPIMWVAASVSGVLSVILSYFQINHALMVAGLVGMVVGYVLTERAGVWKA